MFAAIGAIVGVLVVLLVVVLLRRRNKRSCVVLYGPHNSGKSALFFRLKTGKLMASTSSMKENEGTFVWAEGPDSAPRHLVDIPGHGRLRWRLKDFLPIAKTIVVVLDSTAVGNKEYCTDAANMVWDAIHVGAGPQIVVACNKTDDLLALSAKRIKSLLEAQMTFLARTRSKYPAFHDGENADQPAEETVAAAGTAFTFETSSPVPVEFVAISVKRGGQDLKPLFDVLKN